MARNVLYMYMYIYICMEYSSVGPTHFTSEQWVKDILNLLYFNVGKSVFMPEVHKINVCKSSFNNFFHNDPNNLTNVGLIQLLI